MLPLRISPDADRPLHVLCLGAHSDDIEIGCGGTILTLLRRAGPVHVRWVVFSAEGDRAEEARASADRFLAGADGKEVVLHSYRDGFFPFQGAEIKETFEAMKRGPAPDLVFTHERHDRHQDHRLVSDLTWNTFREHLILEYEIPKYDGGLTTPNLFVELAEEIRAMKIDILRESFPSQAKKSWFSRETFDALMRLRGVESAAPEGYAEGFHARKIRIEAGG